MSFQSIGDLAFSFQNMRHNFELKSSLQRLSAELTSGQKSDLSSSVSGDYLPLVGIERLLTNAAAFSTATAETALIASSTQAALELIQTQSSDLGPALLTAGTAENAEMIKTTSFDAKVKFEAVLSALNTRVADRYIFSGTDTDAPAVADVGTIIGALQTAISAETTALGVESVVNNWFDDPSGFETIGYLGSSNGLAPIRVSEDDQVDLDVTAANDDLRNVLKGLAMVTLLAEGALSASNSERGSLMRASGERLLSAQSNLSVVRAKVGSTEERIDSVTSNNSARTTALEIARSNITSIDPYKTVTELQAVQTQLETFYTLTARLSRLTLAEYLR